MLYSLGHTALTRLGEEGADVFTIMTDRGPFLYHYLVANQHSEVLGKGSDTRTDTALPS